VLKERKKKHLQCVLEKRVSFSFFFNGIIEDIFNITGIFENIKLHILNLKTCPIWDHMILMNEWIFLACKMLVNN